AKGGDLKRRLMFYQMLAAASVVFAMAIGGAGYYLNFKADETPVNRLALENKKTADHQPAEVLSSQDEQRVASDATPPQDAVNTPVPPVNESTLATNPTRPQPIG